MGRRGTVNIFDITRPLSGDNPVYPGDVKPIFCQTDNGVFRTSELQIGSHTGTHIDAPSHYLRNGDSIDSVPLGKLIGRCLVLDVKRAGTRITADDLAKSLHGCVRLLIRTAYSGMNQFIEDYPCLTFEAARLLTEQGIQCLGIDSPSVESFDGKGDIHRQLLENGCIIIELLDLSQVKEGNYEMVALPLRLSGLDGSPARVILIECIRGE